jgi:iron(III) transport system ATP-binding protein
MEGLFLQRITSGYKDKIILNNLSLSVMPKEPLILMGISGGGKTTLLKTIIGIIQPQQGTIVLNGRDITSLPIEDRKIGYLSQDYGLFPHLTVGDNIAYGPRINGASVKEQQTITKDLLGIMGLSGYENKAINDLSGGQRQRVALARALATKPDLLLLDEPLSSIDQVTKFDVATHLKTVFESLNIPIIFVTHQYEDARFLGGRLAIMDNGALLQVGEVQDVVNNPKNLFVKKLLTPIFEQ